MVGTGKYPFDWPFFSWPSPLAFNPSLLEISRFSCLTLSLVPPLPPSILQLRRQPNQSSISPHTQRRQHHNRIPTRPKLFPPQPILSNLTKELSISLIPSIQAHQQDPNTVCSEEGADRVEFRSEDLEDDQGEGELAQGGTDVGSFEGTLGGAHFDESEICVRVKKGRKGKGKGMRYSSFVRTTERARWCRRCSRSSGWGCRTSISDPTLESIVSVCNAGCACGEDGVSRRLNMKTNLEHVCELEVRHGWSCDWWSDDVCSRRSDTGFLAC